MGEATAALGRCARHPERPGFALCGRCGDSACRGCALDSQAALCRACEEFQIRALGGRRRQRDLPRAAFLWIALWLGLFGVLPQLISFAPDGGDPRPAGLVLAALLSLMTLHDLSLARVQVEPWLADIKSRLDALHGRAEAGEAIEGGERQRVMKAARRRAPRLLGAERYPSSRSWQRVFRQGLGLVLVAAFKLVAWLVLGEEGLFAKAVVAVCGPAGLFLMIRGWSQRGAR